MLDFVEEKIKLLHLNGDFCETCCTAGIFSRVIIIQAFSLCFCQTFSPFLLYGKQKSSPELWLIPPLHNSFIFASIVLIAQFRSY